MRNKAEINEQNSKIIEGLERAYEKLVEYKRYKKSPLVISRNGEVIEVSPEEIPLSIRYKRSHEN